jgi:hypothetical protein
VYHWKVSPESVVATVNVASPPVDAVWGEGWLEIVGNAVDTTAMEPKPV